MTRKRIRAVVTGLLALGAALATQACTDPVETEVTQPGGVDREFANGSRIEDQELTAVQVENLALLAKVWGFAKYHHPAIVAGARNWDYDLFRAVPSVLEASNGAAAAAALTTWLDSLGPVAPCGPCAQAPAGAHLLPENEWIGDEAVLGSPLSDRLVEIHRNRPVAQFQRYVAFVQNVGNPDFTSESYYGHLPNPDAGYRLLALFRFWNIIEYWFPYRDVMGEDWEAVLREFIPVVMQPMDGDTYRLALMRLIARVHDTHANVWSELAVQPPLGTGEAPLGLRFVEGKLVVTEYTDLALGPATGMEVGDEIHRIDGRSVESLVDSLRPYYPASNEAARLRDMGKRLTRGTGPALLEGVGAEGPFSRAVSRQTRDAAVRLGSAHDIPGPTFRMLSDSVAYVKISTAQASSAASYITQAQGAAVLVIDVRNYPTDFVVFALGGHLVDGPVPFARFTTADPSNPGAFLLGGPVMLTPRQPRFTGKVVILVDEVTQSAAEYTAMGLRAAPNAIVVGSTTAGADGNVSRIPLPGGVQGMISGIGVFYPDGTPTQRLGIVPDVDARPTVEGIRAGRDEVLEAAVSHALGRPFHLSGASARAPLPLNR